MHTRRISSIFSAFRVIGRGIDRTALCFRAEVTRQSQGVEELMESNALLTVTLRVALLPRPR
jgi:hypothetical protein